MTYKDPQFFIYPAAYPHSATLQRQYLARHETVNGRLKSFNVLRDAYRHNLVDHPSCVYAVANIVQIMIDAGHKLYDV